MKCHLEAKVVVGTAGLLVFSKLDLHIKVFMTLKEFLAQ